MKGFLTWHQSPFRRTHDLEELGEACATIDATLAPLMEQADALSDYAWKLRYPGSPYIPEPVETEAMFALASAAFREIETRLSIQAGASENQAKTDKESSVWGARKPWLMQASLPLCQTCFDI